jgi:hypothetical protein
MGYCCHYFLQSFIVISIANIKNSGTNRYVSFVVFSGVKKYLKNLKKAPVKTRIKADIKMAKSSRFLISNFTKTPYKG